MGIKPIKVERPANDVKINGYNINNHLIKSMLIMINYCKYMINDI